jgi:PadR family transcriptional regulator, regulatory protein AphA
VTLRPSSYLVLGMLRLGVSSGYAIKQAADVSTRFFCPTSLAQVYPELAHLEREGLVRRRDDSHGGRARHAYELTSKGESILLRWLRSEHHAPTQLRDEGVLRLFFADALQAEDQRALVRRLRERARAAKAHMRAEILPLAEAAEKEGVGYPAVVARLGADSYAYAERWLARLEEGLDGDELSD